jgi:hypothetical protein
MLHPALAEIQGMNLPFWMISEVVLIALGLLTAAEWYSESDADLRRMLERLKTHIIKPGVNGALQFGLVSGQSAAVLDVLAYRLPPEALAWLVSLGPGVAVASTGGVNLRDQAVVGALSWIMTAVAAGWALLMATGTWLLALFRQKVVDLIAELDDGDNLGLLRMLSLAEGGWTITLTVVLIVAPFLALTLTLLTLLMLLLIRKWFERRDERSKVPCATCGTPIYPMALFCHSCRHTNQAPRKVGVFGQAKAAPATDRATHRLNLMARKRCHCCASRLVQKTIRQVCPACGTATFDDASEVNAYLRTLDKKLPLTLLICGALGALPVIGIVPGIVYYRLSLVAGLRAYLPSTVGCLTRWGVRLASTVLVMLQPFFLGWLTLPAMALLNYVVYRQVLLAGRGRLSQLSPTAGRAPALALAAGAGSPVIALATPTGEHHCTACGAANLPTGRFCTRCGAPIAG